MRRVVTFRFLVYLFIFLIHTPFHVPKFIQRAALISLGSFCWCSQLWFMIYWPLQFGVLLLLCHHSSAHVVTLLKTLHRYCIYCCWQYKIFFLIAYMYVYVQFYIFNVSHLYLFIIPIIGIHIALCCATVASLTFPQQLSFNHWLLWLKIYFFFSSHSAVCFLYFMLYILLFSLSLCTLFKLLLSISTCWKFVTRNRYS